MSDSHDSRDWLVEGWYRYGSANLLGGAVGAGKTGLEIGLLAAAFRGDRWFGRQTTCPTRWVQIITDRSPSNRLYWAKKHGIELPGPDATYCVAEHLSDRPQLQTKTTHQSRMLATIEWLRSKLEKLKPERKGVVTIDVVTPFFPPSTIDYQQGYWMGMDLMKLMQDFPSCYLLLAHGSKFNQFSSAGRMTDRIIGNTGTLGVMDTQSYISSATEAAVHSRTSGVKLPKGAQIFAVLPRESAELEVCVVRDELGMLRETRLEAAEEEVINTVADAEVAKDQKDTAKLGRPVKLSLEEFIQFLSYDTPTNAMKLFEKIVKEREVSIDTVRRRFKEAQTQGLIMESGGGWIRSK